MARFGLDQVQAQAILDMRLKALQGLDREKLQKEYDDLEEKIAYFRRVLSDDALVRQILKEELSALAEKIRRRAQDRDPGCGGRDRYRGPDRGGAVRLYPHQGRVH